MWIPILLAFSLNGIPGVIPSNGGLFSLRMGRFYTHPDTCTFRLDLIMPGVPDTYRFALQIEGGKTLQWERVLKTPHEYFIEPVQFTVARGEKSLSLWANRATHRDSLTLLARCPALSAPFTLSSLWFLTHQGNPNPLHRYTWKHDTLWFYVEVYTENQGASDTGVMMALITDTTGTVRAQIDPIRVPLSRWRTPLKGKIPLRALDREGLYTLMIVFQKGTHRKILRDVFWFESPPLSDTLAEALATFLPEGDRARFRSLTRVQKIFFLKRKLSFLPPDVFSTFQERLAYVQEHFREPGKPSYLTDRGRIYLLFGPPDRRLFYSEMRNYPPQEHWYYYNPSMAFVFIDIDRTGVYRLAYSTQPEIPVTPNLERWIYDEEGLLPRRGQ